MLGQVGDDQHVAPPRLSNNLIYTIFINNRGLPLQGEICGNKIHDKLQTTKLKMQATCAQNNTAVDKIVHNFSCSILL